MTRIISTVAALLLAVSAASAQQITVTKGVYIDGKGVLRSSEVDPSLASKNKGSKDEKLVYISLPRLFAEARKCQIDGKPIPDSIRYLDGMVKLQYVFVYPDEKDVVIAGRAEPFDADGSMQPVGKVTGRPVLQLDDLIVALRAHGAVVGCSLEVDQALADLIHKKTKEIGPKAPDIGDKEASRRIADAAGLQSVKYLGEGDDNRFAVICIAADYQLKQLELGLLKSPVKGVNSYMAMSGPPVKSHRFAFECGYDSLAVSPDGNVFELRGPSLKVVTSLYDVGSQAVPKDGDICPAAKKFAAQCSEHFDELCQYLPSFADLGNLSDLSVVAALIAREDVAKKAGLDLSWVLDKGGYKLPEIAAPKSAAVLCSYRHYDQSTIFVAGGVALDPTIKNIVKDEKGLAGKAKRPQGTDWKLN